MIINFLKTKPLHYLLMYKIKKIGNISVSDKIPVIIPIGLSINGEGIILMDYSTTRTKFNIDTVDVWGKVGEPYTAPASRQHVFILQYTKKIDLIQTALDAYLNKAYTDTEDIKFSFISPLAFIPSMKFTGSNETIGTGDTRLLTLSFTEDMKEKTYVSSGGDVSPVDTLAGVLFQSIQSTIDTIESGGLNVN